MSESSLVFTIAIAGGILFLASCYKIPQWLANRHSLPSAKDKAELEDAYRKTVAQVLGGFALVVTFAWTFLKDRESLDQGRMQIASQQSFQHAQLALQQFVEGAKLLKEDDIGTSAAGVDALGQVAATQPEYQSAVVTTLVSFIKGGKATPSRGDPAIRDGAPGTIPANIQAALSVIARRNQSIDEQIIGSDNIYREGVNQRGNRFRLDLYRAYLVRARFSGLGPETAFRNVNFQAASLYGADFHGLDLSNTGFDGSRMADSEAFGSEWTTSTPKDSSYIDPKHLFTVNFEGTRLVHAGFDNVRMGGANLRDADLAGASFYKADLSRADLTGANLTGAKNVKNGTSFQEATLTDAIFAKTDLDGVNCQGAKLSGTDFREAINLEKADFTDACSDRDPLFDRDTGGKFKFRTCASR